MRDENLRPDNIFRQTLFGVPIVQEWCDLWLWEQVFEQTPDLKGVIELGTLKGGLAAAADAAQPTVLHGGVGGLPDAVPAIRRGRSGRTAAGNRYVGG